MSLFLLVYYCDQFVSAEIRHSRLIFSLFAVLFHPVVLTLIVIVVLVLRYVVLVLECLVLVLTLVVLALVLGAMVLITSLMSTLMNTVCLVFTVPAYH